MKRYILLLIAGLLTPVAVFADNCMYIGAGSDAEIYNYSDGESWYSEPEYHGVNEVSIEWQWQTFAHTRALRFRRVVFHPIGHFWSFGPWEIKVEVCLPGCRIHHVHCYPYHYCAASCGCCGHGHRVRKSCVAYRYYRFEGVPKRTVHVYRYESPARSYCHRAAPSVRMPQRQVRTYEVGPAPVVHRTIVRTDQGAVSSISRVREPVKPPASSMHKEMTRSSAPQVSTRSQAGSITRTSGRVLAR